MNTQTPFDPNSISVTHAYPHDPYGGITLPYDPHGSLTLGSIGPVEDFIHGEMINAQVIVKDFELTEMNMDPDNFKQTMKKRLVEIIAEHLLNNKLVEFTKQEDLNTNETTFRARAYLVKDDKVRILRKTFK